MAIAQAIPQKYLRFEEDYSGPYVFLDDEVMTWIKERDPKFEIVTHHTVDHVTYLPSIKAIIKFSDDITAVEFRLTWL